QTTMMLAGAIVAVLAATQYAVDRRRLNLLLASGFSVGAGSTLAFSIAPVLGGQPLHRAEAWAGVAGRLLGAGLIAVAAFARGRTQPGRRIVSQTVVGLALVLVVLWAAAASLGSSLPSL